jgi:hypothetical protein
MSFDSSEVLAFSITAKNMRDTANAVFPCVAFTVNGKSSVKTSADGKRIRFDCFDPEDKKMLSFVIEQKRLMGFTIAGATGEAMLLEFANLLRECIVQDMPDALVVGDIGIKDASIAHQYGFYITWQANANRLHTLLLLQRAIKQSLSKVAEARYHSMTQAAVA